MKQSVDLKDAAKVLREQPPQTRLAAGGTLMAATVGIIIHSNHYRTSIATALKSRDEFVPIDLGDGTGESLSQLLSLEADLLLVDLPARRLVTLLRAIRSEFAALPILALNCDEEESELLALFEAGLSGFVTHEATDDGLAQAIRSTLQGEFHCPPRIAAALVRRVNAAGQSNGSASTIAQLTPREIQVVRLLEASMTNKEIAARLGIEAETVRNHVYHICCKLRAHRRVEVVSRLQEGSLTR